MIKHCIAIAALFVFGSCTTNTVREARDSRAEVREDAEANLCEIDRPLPRNAEATIRIGDGSIVNGPIRNIATVGYNRIFTSIAAPADAIEVEYSEPGYCCQSGVHPWYPWNGFGYWCVQWPRCDFTDVYELHDIFGIGRGSNREEAASLAMESCEQSVQNLIRSNRDLRRYQYEDELHCEIVTSDTCVY